MPVHHRHAIRDQRVGGADRRFRVAGIVDGDFAKLLAVDAPGGVDVGHRQIGAGLQLFAERGVRTGERAGNADFDLRLGRRGGGKADGHAGGSREKDVTQGGLLPGILFRKTRFLYAPNL